MDELGAALQVAEIAVSGVGGDAEVEGLALPPVEHVRLAHARVGQRQHGVGARARAAVHGAHAQDAALLVRAQPDHRVPALEAQPVPGVGLDAVSLKGAAARAHRHRRHESLAIDQCRIGLAVSGGRGEIDDAGPVRRVPQILDPDDIDSPLAAADVHELQGLFTFHSSVGKLYPAFGYLG